MRLHLAFGSFLLLAACGVDERPPASQDVTSTISAATSEDESDESRAASEGEPSEDYVPPPACEPGATQVCKIFWSSEGIQHCIVAKQRCSDDGYRWLACGE